MRRRDRRIDEEAVVADFEEVVAAFGRRGVRRVVGRIVGEARTVGTPRVVLHAVRGFGHGRPRAGPRHGHDDLIDVAFLRVTQVGQARSARRPARRSDEGSGVDDGARAVAQPHDDDRRHVAIVRVIARRPHVRDAPTSGGEARIGEAHERVERGERYGNGHDATYGRPRWAPFRRLGAATARASNAGHVTYEPIEDEIELLDRCLEIARDELERAGRVTTFARATERGELVTIAFESNEPSEELASIRRAISANAERYDSVAIAIDVALEDDARALYFEIESRAEAAQYVVRYTLVPREAGFVATLDVDGARLVRVPRKLLNAPS